MVDSPAEPIVAELPGSRSNMLPQGRVLQSPNSLGDRYSLLIFLKGLVEGRDIRPIINTTLDKTIDISSDFNLDENGKAVETRLRGNEAAGTLLLELDELIELARRNASVENETPVIKDQAMKDPVVENADDWVRGAVELRYRDKLLDGDSNLQVTLQRSLEWADRWAEVRFRFLHHYLRDDPTYYGGMDEGGMRKAGLRANAIVHESGVEIDCELAESKWFTDEYRELYLYVYGLTTKEGRRLLCLSGWMDLKGSLRNLFQWVISYINRVVDWRQDVLRKAIQNALSVQRGGNQIRNVRGAHRQNEAMLHSVNQSYKAFILSLRAIMSEANLGKTLRTSTFNTFNTRITDLTRLIRVNRLNDTPGLKHTWSRDMRAWPAKFSDSMVFPAIPTRPNNSLIPGR
ncbi:uncharacterized protein F4822DRAFT_387111, partial [Hypoxylon trugodes]|uniref:uncharacterized protein n=1 Tax=Hypoxylon trugodes TaxID=326681 RepID=UPI0021946B1A